MKRVFYLLLLVEAALVALYLAEPGWIQAKAIFVVFGLMVLSLAGAIRESR